MWDVGGGRDNVYIFGTPSGSANYTIEKMVV